MRKLASIINQWITSVLGGKTLSPDIDQGHLATVLVAVLCGSRSPIPTTPVTRPEEWYLQNCFSGNENLIGMLNELTPLYFSDALAIAKEVWLTKYRMVHNPFSTESLNVLTQYILKDSGRLPKIYSEWANISTVSNGLRETIYQLNDELLRYEAMQHEANN